MAFVEYKGEILPYSFEDKAIDKVLELEGGYNPKDPVTGMPVKYGIDQRANPDIDVSKLTKEDARRIYRDRYWSASGAANLPEKLALVHFDAAVNQGPEKAKQLLEASGGDPDKYVQLRKEEYQRLAEQDPKKYGSSLKGWINRLDALQGSFAPAFEEYSGEIIPLDKSLADRAKDIIQKTISPITETVKTLASDEKVVEPQTGLSAEMAREQFKSGLTKMQMDFYINAARNNANLLNTFDLVDQGKPVPEKDRDMAFDYSQMNKEQRQAFRDALQAAQTSSTAKAIKYNEEQKGYARNPYADKVIELANEKDFSGAWEMFKKDPAGIMQQLSVESAPNTLPSLIAGASGLVLRGGTAGLMVGLAGGSFPVEFMSSITDSLRDSGVDMSDDKAIEAKLRDPAFVEAAGKRALGRGTIIAAADAASGKLLSPLKAGQLSKNIARGAGNVGVEIGTEMAGEAGAQAVSGEDLKIGDILAEGLGAGPQAVSTTALKTVTESGKPVETEKLEKGVESVPRERIVPEEIISAEEQKKKDAATVRELALEEQRKAGWNPDWPFVPADLGNKDFRELIKSDPSISLEEKTKIFDAGKKLGVVAKDETIEAKPSQAELAEEKQKATLVPVSPSQNTDVMMAELEGRLPKAPAKEVKVEEAPVEEAAPLEKAVSVKDMSPEDRKTIRAMEVEKNKISREKKLFPEFLRRQGVQPSEKADLGLEGISRPGIFKKSAPTFDELTSRAINEGFLVSTGDDVQDVENFREHVRDYIGSGQITTGPDTAREAQLNSLDEAIQEIVRKYEKPSFGLEQPTPADLRAREEATKLREAEAARIEEEDKARRDREEIARLSQESEFALGRTAAEDLMGQKNIFEQPADIEAEMAKKADEGKAEAERIRQQGGEDADIPFLNIERKQTSTPEFKKWFGDSKIVDKNGNPLIMYHGTNQKIGQFNKTTRYDDHVPGISVTDDYSMANSYALEKAKKNGGSPNVESVYIKSLKPMIYEDLENWTLNKAKEKNFPVKDEEDFAAFDVPPDTLVKWLKEEGYDSIDYRNDPMLGYGLRVFEPTQIKSAIGNRGTFSPEELDITLDTGKERKSIISRNEEIREEKIREKQGLARREKAIVRRFSKEGSKKGDMLNVKMLTQQIDLLDQEIDDLYEEDRRPVAFLNRASKALADKKDPLSQDVYDVLFALYKKNPQLLDGLKLSVTALPGEKTAAGEFKHLERTIRLYKDTSGMEDPATLLHELTHSLEQMMKKGAKKALAAKWGEEFKRAYLAEKTTEGKEFFQAVIDMLAKPSDAAFEKAVSKIPALPDGQTNYKYYQFISPSEYWAVNATPLMQAYMGTSWQKFKNSVKALFETLKDLFGVRNNRVFYQTFNQVINGPRLGYTMLNHYISESIPTMNIHRNYLGGQPPLATWDSTGDSKLADFKSDLIYKLQDKFIDLKDAEKAIRQVAGEIEERWDAYMQEELYHGRTAKRTEDFLRDELLPIIKELKAKNLTLDQFEEYLHNRHAEERNAQIARINKDMPDGGSGIMTKDAREYLAKLDPKQKAALDSVAKMVDDMVYETQEILLNEGLEDAKTINTWRKTYKYYVALERDLDVAGQTFTPGSQGYGTRGKTSKRATGSEKDVINILANLAIQREKAIMKAEKAKVGRALYGLAIKNPNPDFWMPVNPDAIKDPKALAKELQSLGLSAEDALNFIKEPVTKMVKDGVVIYAPNINDRFADSVLPIRVNGQDRFIFFNTKNPAAVRLVKSLKNIDVQQLAGIIGMTAKITRFVAAMNTQYNPVFGAWNFTRDVAGAMFNLSTTPIADQKAKVLAGTFPALRAIYKDLRAERKEETKSDKEWSKLFERFQNAGGQTGYKNQFAESEKKANIIEREMAYLDRGNVKKTVDAIAGWLSDYNDAMENAVRLSAFKAAIDKGYSDAKAASIAKNLTVNFNRKGAWSTGIGALYAFFNASVQGTARLAETMTGPAGKKIFAGGLLLGAFQALALSMAGFDEDEPPEFLKDKNLIIPYGDGKYVIVPMPLGFNAIPSTGRRITELVLTNGEDASGKIIDMMGMWADAFNPIGTGSLAQMMSPTFADPIVSASMNKDTFGRPIYKEDRATAPVPGYMMSRDGASTFSKYLSEFINYVTSPSDTKYTKGKFSPTADEIDYIIGQYTGGVGREAMKAGETAKGLITGEPVEPHRKPISGKILGDIESKQAVTSKFYKNVTDLAKLEGEVKGRAENQEDAFGYIKRHPKAKLMDMANDVENEVSQINQDIKEIRKRRPDDKDAVQRMEDTKLRIMRNFNKRVRESEK